jgi:hypothetical protein
MREGTIRELKWEAAPPSGFAGAVQGMFAKIGLQVPAILGPLTAAGPSIPKLDPPPKSAEEEAIRLLRIGAEIEGALLAEYLFAAYSICKDISAQGSTDGTLIESNKWIGALRTIAKQEMGHLITVQNLLLSLGAEPHVDRENYPINSSLYPFPFDLAPLSRTALARYVSAEAPSKIASGDEKDAQDAMDHVGMDVGQVTRAGLVYERLFWLFQDSDKSQAPWPELKNPFPDWDDWHVNGTKVGLNPERQANALDWEGDDTGPADTSIYVVKIKDRAGARDAIFAIASQGEGPVAGDPTTTHFEKFLRIYHEYRSLADVDAAKFVRKQAPNPRAGLDAYPKKPANITDPKTLAWAQLANTRYHVLLMDILLSLSQGPTGTLPSTTASTGDFSDWALSEMPRIIAPLAMQLRDMPLEAGAGMNGPLAGFPFEFRSQPLPTSTDKQLQYLRDRLKESAQLRADIITNHMPTGDETKVLQKIGEFDTAMAEKLGGA